MNKEDQTPISSLVIDDEIDFVGLLKTVWESRRTIIISTIIFAIIGLFIAIFSPKQYSVTTVMVPQVNTGQNKLGSLSSLAAMAGFNLEMNTGSELSPLIYPQIVQSIPFRKELMYTKLNFEGYEQPISYYEYYTNPIYSKTNPIDVIKKFTIGLPATVITLLKGREKVAQAGAKQNSELIELTTLESLLIKQLKTTVSLKVDQVKGYISLEVKMPEARVAAQLGQRAQDLLQQYITEFKVEKAQAKLDFVKERYLEKKLGFEEAQNNLAQFRDKNKYVTSAIAQTEEERLQSEYQIAQSVYTELAKQLENSLIQVKEETPVFSIIEPISIPSENIKPKRKQILIIWIFIGGIVGIAWIFGKHYLADIKNRWEKER